MKITTLILPRDIQPDTLPTQSAVVFDVLRATTSITSALSAKVKEVRVFTELDATLAAAKSFDGPKLTCGERHTLPPPGFDLGNSPGQFTADHAGRTVFMSTTNGTRAIVAAKSAKLLLAGALVNATAVANRLLKEGLDVTLVCSGSDGQPSMEDLLGAGAVATVLQKMTTVQTVGDPTRIAIKLFNASCDDLRGTVADTHGGHHIHGVGLDADITFAARLDVFETVGIVRDTPLRVVADSAV